MPNFYAYVHVLDKTYVSIAKYDIIIIMKIIDIRQLRRSIQKLQKPKSRVKIYVKLFYINLIVNKFGKP